MTITHRDSTFTKLNNIIKYPFVAKFESIPFTATTILAFRKKDPGKAKHAKFLDNMIAEPCFLLPYIRYDGTYVTGQKTGERETGNMHLASRINV